MKRLLLLSVSLLAVAAVPAQAQTHAANGMTDLAIRNAKVCDRYDQLATCSDQDVIDAFCAARTPAPVGAMCTAVAESRPTSDRILTVAQFAAELDEQVAAAAKLRLAKQRKATVAAIEIAMLDATTRAAICTAAKSAPGLGAGVTALLNACR